MSSFSTVCPNTGPFKDCYQVRQAGYSTSGMYLLKTDGTDRLTQAWCEHGLDNGGWTVLQRRKDGSVNFFRNWENYKVWAGRKCSICNHISHTSLFLPPLPSETAWSQYECTLRLCSRLLHTTQDLHKRYTQSQNLNALRRKCSFAYSATKNDPLIQANLKVSAFCNRDPRPPGADRWSLTVLKTPGHNLTKSIISAVSICKERRGQKFFLSSWNRIFQINTCLDQWQAHLHSCQITTNSPRGARISTERLWQHRRRTLAWAGKHLQPGETRWLQTNGGAGGLAGEKGLRRVQQLPSGVRERGLPAEAGHLPGQRRGLLQQSQRQTVHHTRPWQGCFFRWGDSTPMLLDCHVGCHEWIHVLLPHSSRRIMLCPTPTGNCAHFHKGGWWYNACGQTNLNGVWYSGGIYRSKFQDGIFWAEYGGGYYSLKSVRLMIRPID